MRICHFPASAAVRARVYLARRFRRLDISEPILVAETYSTSDHEMADSVNKRYEETYRMSFVVEVHQTPDFHSRLVVDIAIVDRSLDAVADNPDADHIGPAEEDIRYHNPVEGIVIPGLGRNRLDRRMNRRDQTC